MVKDLIRVKDRVAAILIKYPKTRDCDKLLFLAYCKVHCNLDSALDGTYQGYKTWFMSGQMPKFESITRARRKIQEENPKLAGVKRHHRKIEAENVRAWSNG